MNKLHSSLLALMAGAAAVVTAPALAEDLKPGDAGLARKQIDMCIGCHGIDGYQASFPQIYKVPMISGQNAKYIVAALTAYKKGERKHPTMRAIATSLNDQDMANVAAFYEQHGKGPAGAALPAPPEPPADVAALLAKGNCTSCHGANFNQPIDPSYPKLAGQHRDYLYVALKAYQTDNNPQVGRANVIMKGMVKPYTHDELKRLGQWIGSLKGELRTVEQSSFRTTGD